MHEGAYRPDARSDGMLVEVLDDELLVFDSERQVAHSLNASAARVWEACDGSRSVSELAEQCKCDESTVLLALARLRDVNLLEPDEIKLTLPSGEPDGVSRRAMLRKSVVAGAGVGLAIPVIRSITAPSIAMASSGRGRNAKNAAAGGPVCSKNSQCSPGSICGTGHHCLRPIGATCSPTSACSLGGGSPGGTCVGGTCN